MKTKLATLLGFFLFPFTTFAEKGDEVNLIFDDRNITINFEAQPELLTKVPKHFLRVGTQRLPVDLTGTLLAKESDLLPIETEFETQISTKGLQHFFEDALALSEMENAVEIYADKNNNITFDGVPKEGYKIDKSRLKDLLELARKSEDKNVRVPAKKSFSRVVVDPKLEEQGIQEIVAIGKSNFSGSSDQRRQNIRAAARKFNGYVLGKGKNFSFNHQLKNVSERDGFVKELVILGNNLSKELGGGTCQVSTTAFRAAFFGGFPILNRRNHSYAVPYYKPIGIDATIYLGGQDFEFKNDTPGDILIQTFTEGDNLYFVFYGTSDDRKVVTEGPFISDIRPNTRPPRVIMTNTLPPGKTKWISGSHDGLHAEWVRKIEKNGRWQEEIITSDYRPWRAQIMKGRPREVAVDRGNRN